MTTQAVDALMRQVVLYGHSERHDTGVMTEVKIRAAIVATLAAERATLLDEFAGQAMAAIITTAGFSLRPELVAESAYQYAAQMLAARGKYL